MPPDVSDVFVLAANVVPVGSGAAAFLTCRHALAGLVETSWKASSDWSRERSPAASAASRKAKADFQRDWRGVDPDKLVALLRAAADLPSAELADLLTRIKAQPGGEAAPAEDAAEAS